MDTGLLYSQLIRIDGLNIWEGLSHVGCNREVYADALRLFYGELETKIAALGAALESGRWKDYSMVVHAVKGALAGIGAWELAAVLLELEEASRNGDYEKCRSGTGKILESMGVFAAALRATELFAEKDENPREEAPLSFLTEKLQALEEACAAGTSEKADALAEEIRTKTFGKDADQFVEKVCAYIENLDYDLVLEALKNPPR